MQVAEIWRYPVKSLQGESLTEAHIGEHGVTGDRAWALFDPATDAYLTARRQPELLFAAAKVVDDEVVVVLPDGTETADDAALSTWLGRPVELRPADDQAHTFETQAPTEDGSEVEAAQWFQWQGPAGSYHDSTVSKISIVSPGWFRDWDPRRFRINVVLDGPGDLELVGRSIRIGDAEATVHKRIDRCIMTTRPQPPLGDSPALERDLDVLRTINREDETFLGVGALIDRTGTLRLGDQITPTEGS